MMPSCDHTGTPPHFNSSTSSGSASLSSLRCRLSISPRQSSCALICASICCEAGLPLFGPVFFMTRSGSLSGVGSNSAAVLLQVVLERMRRSRDVQLAVSPVDDQRCIADDCITGPAGFSVPGAVIEVEPAKVMLVDPHHDQLLHMSIFMLGQRGVEIERSDLVFLEPGVD